MRAAGLTVALATLALAPGASAYWSGTGAGAGSAPVATLSTAGQPTVAVAVAVVGQAVTVQWSQTLLRGAPLGGYPGGGYLVRRRPAAGGAAAVPSGTCSGVVGGAQATLSCQDADAAPGSWRYTVMPVLGTWTGGESAPSAAVTVTLPAPELTSVAAQNPRPDQQTGDIAVSWTAVAGAEGYNVYRRTASGAYDYATPRNGATPLTGTGYVDPGTGLAGGATYAYVVRAVGSAIESPSSAERSASVITRPAAPAGVTASPVSGARITIGWSAVAGADGYNVYRRTSTGAFDYSAPLNGSTIVTAAGYTDAAATSGTTYGFVVRAVTIGAGGVQVEGPGSAESPLVTADGAPPPAPSWLIVGSGAGPSLGSATCGLSAGTRFVNSAGSTAVPLAAGIATPESGETVVFSISGAGATATRAVPATSTIVTTSVDVSALPDGPLVVRATTADAAGNQSAARAPGNGVVKDVVAKLGSLAYTDNAGSAPDTLSGVSECGASVRVTETIGPRPGASGTFTVTAASGSFGPVALEAIAGTAGGTPYGYTVRATDLAANTSPTLTLTGMDTR